jgi:hypothetical protein
MSGDSSVKQSNYITAPIAGLVTNLATSTAAASQDLAAVGQVTSNMRLEGSLPQSSSGTVTGSLNGAIGCFVEFYADGADLGLVFGSSLAAVTGSNVPALATTGVNTAGVCLRIPAGTYRTFYITALTRYLGYVASATGNMRIAVTSMGS